jgi:hypothetical protein
MYCEGCGEWVDTSGSFIEPDVNRQGEYNAYPGRTSIVVFDSPAEPDGHYRGRLAHQCALGAFVREGEVAPPKPR